MRRTLDRYAHVKPSTIAAGSAAQTMFFVEDAKADIAELAAMLKLAAGALVQDDTPMIYAQVHKTLARAEGRA